MFVSRRPARQSRRAGRFRVWTLLATVSICGAALAAEPKSGPQAASPAQYRPETEIDISGPYHAQLLGESYPSTLDIWGPEATLQITLDGQDKPMVGMFLNNQLRVLYKYGAVNFNLTTMVQALYDGCNFNGQYSRIDEKLGPKVAPILLTPDWRGGGGGGVKMPLPRRMADVPGRYGVRLTKDGRSIDDRAVFEVDNRTVKVSAGGRLYVGDYSPTGMAPVYWEGNRMDVFRLTPTENGFKGTLVKEINGKQEEFEAVFVKGQGGGGGHERDWTYVYDAIFNNSPPVWIAKLTLHEDEARVVINIKGEKAAMSGSLVGGILSGTGQYGKTAVSIRALKNPNGFVGVFRKGSGIAVQEGPIILKNRHVRASAAAGPAW